MRIAWVTPYPPDRHGGGGQIRQAHLLSGVASDHEVTLFSPAATTDEGVAHALDRAIEVRPVGKTWLDRGRAGRRIGDLTGVFLPGWASSGGKAREERALAPLRRAMTRELAPRTFDVVIVEFAGLGPLAGDPALARLRRTARWVLTFHNLPSRMASQQAAVASHVRQRALFTREASLALAAERRCANHHDRVIVVSKEDQSHLRSTPPAEVVGNGVDLSLFAPTPLPSAPRIVFIGSLSTTPNVDGAVWFCRSVLPLIRERCPGATVELVGATPAPDVLALDGFPGVEVIANVADTRQHLRAARVAVVPLRIGSGTRLKALEAWGAGRPVVGTTIGLEGLGVEPGRHALVADNATSFASSVVSMLCDEGGAARAEQLAIAGRELVEDLHGWPAATARFRTVLEGL